MNTAEKTKDKNYFRENQSPHSSKQTTMSSTHSLIRQNIRNLRKNIVQLQILKKIVVFAAIISLLY